MLRNDDSLDIARLGHRLRSGELQPTDVMAGVLERIDARGDDKVWIHRVPERELMERAAELGRRGPKGLPLYGLPFAIKDNIDLSGHPTTAACPDYAYVPTTSARVVERLLDSGALAVGKTNLDQFATGLVGTRSPYGVCENAFDRRYISGGSSSGSAVAVAAGLVSFALGTDTAGSGRIPAAFNNIVGLKPTRGLLSTRGVVPACRSLDCVSIFALTAEDARSVLRVSRGFDADDPFSRQGTRTCALPLTFAGCRVGVPRTDQLQFFANADAASLFTAMTAQLKDLGALCLEVDVGPYLSAARLLYEGPWIAERYLAIRDFIETHPSSLFPVTRKIIAAGAIPSAADGFAAYYHLRELRRAAEPLWERIDVLLTPTAGTIYTIAEVAADPICLNSNLGTYTNFINLMDLSAIAVPAGLQRNGLPFGVTLAAPAFADESLCLLGQVIHRSAAVLLGATTVELPPAGDAGDPVPGLIRLAVCGAHMSGLPLNGQLKERGAKLLRCCRTAPRYRLFALEAFVPPRPGLLRVDAGCAIEVEVWAMPTEAFGSFVDSIPAPLCIGTVELEDGGSARGFLCESYAVADSLDISGLGGWRSYLRQRVVG
jgi:allophanate hydrolase